MAFVAVGQLSCTQLIDVSPLQCELDNDCLLRGLPGICIDGVCVAMTDVGAATDPDPRLPGCPDSPCGAIQDPVCFADQCASQARVQPFICDSAPPASGEMILFPIAITEYSQPNRVLPGLKITACERTDVLCMSPTLELTPQEKDVDVPLPFGFDGYLMIQTDATIPFIWQFAQPLTEPGPRREGRLLAPDTIDAIAGIAMVNINQNLGLIAMQASNCAGVPSAGIHFSEPTGEAVGFYIVDLLPNLNATETQFDMNGNFAVGGFFNMPTGLHLFTARIGVDGPMLGAVNAIVRAGALTFLDIRP